MTLSSILISKFYCCTKRWWCNVLCTSVILHSPDRAGCEGLDQWLLAGYFSFSLYSSSTSESRAAKLDRPPPPGSCSYPLPSCSCFHLTSPSFLFYHCDSSSSLLFFLLLYPLDDFRPCKRLRFSGDSTSTLTAAGG